MDDTDAPKPAEYAMSPRAVEKKVVLGLTPSSPTGETTAAAPKTSTPETITAPETPKPAAAAAAAAAAATPKKSYSLEEANRELSTLIKSGKIATADVLAAHTMLRDHAALKEKVDKLKALLGRSSKVQRESKIDLEATQKRLNQALREIERLNQKLDKLQSRPTHSKYIHVLSFYIFNMRQWAINYCRMTKFLTFFLFVHQWIC
jgi:hypothetical protein